MPQHKLSDMPDVTSQRLAQAEKECRQWLGGGMAGAAFALASVGAGYTEAVPQMAAYLGGLVGGAFGVASGLLALRPACRIGAMETVRQESETAAPAIERS